MYASLYRELILMPGKVSEYGDLAGKLSSENMDRTQGTQWIMTTCRKIFAKTHDNRTLEDNLFIGGLFKQRNDLRGKLLAGWAPHKFKELSRRITLRKVSPFQRIIESGISGTKAYLILRGSVRVFSEVYDEGTEAIFYFYLY